MKYIRMLLALITGYAEQSLATFAEFGEQATIPGFKAAADLTGKQYHVVRPSAELTTNLASEVAASAAAKLPLGVLQNDPNTNEAAVIAYSGLSKVVAGASITVNALITYNSSGRAVAAASGDIVIGRCLEAPGADGVVFTALLLPPTRWGSVA